MESKKNCNPNAHDFKLIDKGVHTLEGLLQPAVFECAKCKLKVSTADVVAITMLRHVRGWRTWIIPLLALAVSIVALVKAW
jgi:hypothetical protein